MAHFQLTRRSSVLLPFLLASAVLPSNAQTQPNPVPAAARVTNAAYDPNFYVGMWVTQDGYIGHELRSGGRYDEARGNRKSAYQGNYTLRGDHIDYLDDTGFSADGEFKGGVLYHAGMVLFRENSPTAARCHHPIEPFKSKNVPLGPSAPSVAARTTTFAPSDGCCVPVWLFRSVAM